MLFCFMVWSLSEGKGEGGGGKDRVQVSRKEDWVDADFFLRKGREERHASLLNIFNDSSSMK